MGKGLSKRITAMLAAVCIAVSSCLLCGCYRDRFYNYIVKYMDKITPICSEYRLIKNASASSYPGAIYGAGRDGIIKNNDMDIIVSFERESDSELILTIGDQILAVNKLFMAEKSVEYVTITEMWFRYDDDMENYQDEYQRYTVYVFDNNIFILAYDIIPDGMMGFSLYGCFPFTLYKYDYEKETVQYIDYYVNKGNMHLPVIIEKVEK